MLPEGVCWRQFCCGTAVQTIPTAEQLMCFASTFAFGLFQIPYYNRKEG
jgi:hypothetical protein